MATILATPSAKAQEVLKRYWNLELPVDVEAIARALGVKVEKLPPPGFSGFYQFKDGKPVIQVNSSEAELRQRFTIAHELGHYVLGHPGSYRDGPDTFSLDNHDPFEVAANRFAAELLMPESMIRFLVFKEGITNVTKLAFKAKVSEAAMQYRLKNLSLVG